MIQPDFAEAVAKKRVAIRREIASLEPYMIPGTFGSDLELFQCGKCSKYYNRPLIKFDYLHNETLKSYQTTETCSKCKVVCEVISASSSDDSDEVFLQKLSCPSCKQYAFDITGVILWD
jgi:hypothetical protein